MEDYIYILFTSKIANFKAVIILILQSLILREAVAYLGQKWIKSFAHTTSILLLPITTYFITTVISDNIALSLGMVGALSIVRFRNPVKSPFELIIFFIAITMGITASVSLTWLILFFTSIIFVFIIVKILDKVFNILKNEDNHVLELKGNFEIGDDYFNTILNLPFNRFSKYCRSIIKLNL